MGNNIGEKSQKIMLITIPCFAVLLFAAVYWLGLPPCAITNTYEYGKHNLTEGQIVKPLEGLDFSSGDWKVYVGFHIDDYSTVSDKFRNKGMCLRSDDIDLFRKMQKEWEFVYTGADVATVQSAIYFINDGKVVFESGIVLDDGYEGLQGEYGWLRAEEPLYISDHIKQFERAWWPFAN